MVRLPLREEKTWGENGPAFLLSLFVAFFCSFHSFRTCFDFLMRMMSDEIGRWILDRENSEMVTGTRGKSILAEKTCADHELW